MCRYGHARSSRPELFCKKGVLRNFPKFTGKHLCQSLIFNKVAGLRPATLLKKRLWYRRFPVNFVKFLRTLFFIEHLWWLLPACYYRHYYATYCHLRAGYQQEFSDSKVYEEN